MFKGIKTRQLIIFSEILKYIFVINLKDISFTYLRIFSHHFWGFYHLKNFINSYKYIIFGLFLCIPFWLIESLLHIGIFCPKNSFLEAIFTTCIHELWMRTVGVVFLIIFGIVIHFYNKSRERLTTKLAERNKFINNIFDSIQDGISVLDLELNIIQANHWLEKMYKKHKPIVGKKCYIVHQKRTSICPWCPSVKTISTGEVNSEIVPYSGDDGEQGWIYVTAFPMQDENNNVIGVIEHLKDITELKKVEKDFKDAFNRAEFYKDLFAHDINNILQSILSSTELSNIYLNKPDYEKNITEFLLIIKKQVKRGSKLISNIQTLSRLEKINKSILKINAIEILKKCGVSIKESYPAKKINIIMEFDNDKQYVQANELLNDIFENILSNAVSYNENSVIEITIKTRKVLKDGDNYLKVEFIDNGIGIESLWKEKIFDRAYTEQRNVNGMGLGLSLVKKIIESYNGHIWVENRDSEDYKKGSVFVILIPIDEEL